jgi:hypothetical protein
VFKSGVKALKFELKARILRFKEARMALGDKNPRDKRGSGGGCSDSGVWTLASMSIGVVWIEMSG